jgi:hypothetical protein
MKFEIHFEYRASSRNFQDLNFWDATLSGDSSDSEGFDVEIENENGEDKP